MGGKPSRGTPADKRLKGNKGNPKFGSPAWDAKYGVKQFGKRGKRGR